MDSEVSSPFKIPTRILKTAVTWIDTGSSSAQQTYGIILHLLFPTLVVASHILHFATCDTFKELAYLIIRFLSNFGIFIKTLNFTLRLKKIKDLINMSKKLFDDCAEKGKVNEKFKNAKRFFKVFISMVASTTLVSTFKCAYELPLPMWLPFEVDNNRLAY